MNDHFKYDHWWRVLYRGGKQHAFARDNGPIPKVDSNAVCGMTYSLGYWASGGRLRFVTYSLPYIYEQERTNDGFKCKNCLHIIRTSQKEETVALEQRISITRRRIDALTDELARLESMPEDDFKEGDVVWFNKYFNGGCGLDKPYTYVALKTGGCWWLTGNNQTGSRRKWEEILEFAGWDQPWFEMWYATEWEQICG